MWRLLFLSLPLAATQFQPWYPEMLQIWTSPTYAFETYHIQNRSGYLHRAEGGVLVSPWPTISAELELGLAGGPSQGFFFDAGKITLRYLLLDDTLGDPVSLSFGGSATFSSLTSRRNFATPHLGAIDWALHAALGKETTCERFWVWRFYTVGQVALSNQGAPALWGSLNIIRNFCDAYSLALWTSGLLNFGQRKLFEIPNFRGYGPVQARAADIGIWATRRLSYCGYLCLDYRYRPFASNYPRADHYVAIAWWYPFSL